MREKDIQEYSKRFFPSEDAAHFNLGERKICLTTDMLVGETDVPPGMTPRQIGKKSVVQNLSDLAAMGSSPHYFCASMAFPRSYALRNAKRIIDGIDSTCGRYDVDFVGGDTNEGELSIAGFALGSSEKIVLRSGARVGDVVCLTGDVGRVSAGLADLKRATREMKKKIFEPEARVEEGRNLVATSCIDVSDGLSSELHTISECSHVRIDVDSEKIPMHEDVSCAARRAGRDTITFALGSGEEYELLFTCAQRNLEKNDFDFSVIGRVSGGKGVFLDGVRMRRVGWEHFR